MQYHAWLIFNPGDTDASRVMEAARHWMSTLPGERDPRTEAIDTRPDGTKVYRIAGDVVAWRAWQAREGPCALCSERPEWPTFPVVYEPPQLKRMRGEK